MFTLPDLPYAIDALEPFISAQTMDFHYHKHHQSYINNLNNLIEDTPFALMTLEDIITSTAGKPQYTAIFNNAAQAWNHTFFWKSMQPDGGKIKNQGLTDKLIRDFGSIEHFKILFKQNGVSQFGSGWVWLAEDNDGTLSVIKTANADTPLAHNLKPLLTCDVWEHAYYLDYQNRRTDFIDAFLNHLMSLN